MPRFAPSGPQSLVALTSLLLASTAFGQGVLPHRDIRSLTPRLTQVVEQTEYEIRATPAWREHQAPNRAQGFRTLFTPDGIRVLPRTATATEVPAWSWGLRLSAIGRDGATRPIDAAPICSARGHRFEYTYAVPTATDVLGLTEWYVNDARGLEQGFLIEAPPAEGFIPLLPIPLVPVRIDMEVVGTLEGALDASGDGVSFTTPHGAAVLRFAGLTVFDASGRILPAHFLLDEDCDLPGSADRGAQRLSVVVDDRDAIYPVTIDPIATSPLWATEGGQPSAAFGASVASAGDVNGDGYNDVIVGSENFDNGQTDEGAAFLFHGTAAGLSTTPAWTAEGNQATALFGCSVATAGDVNGDGFSDVIVGAYLYDNGQSNEGRAFVYHGSASGLAATPAWTAESDQASASFGFSVATAGDINGDGFSDCVVGAYQYDNGESNEGRAYVYLGSATGLSPSPAWVAEGNQNNARLGFSVAMAGDVNADGFSDLVVGAYGAIGGGRADVYLGSGAGLPLSPSWFAQTGQTGANFGFSVAGAGDLNGDGYSDLVIGSPLYDNGELDEGAAFVYHGSPSGLTTTPAATLESNLADANFGRSVSTAGDVNGDGYADCLVGSPFFTNNETLEGRVFLFHGSPDGVSNTPLWTSEVNQVNANFGESVATAGDVNGDGFSDIVVGAFTYDNGESNEGGAFAFYGAATDLTSTPAWSKIDLSSALRIRAANSAGDVNGDGFGDIVLAAVDMDVPSGLGSAIVYYGSEEGPATTSSWVSYPGTAEIPDFHLWNATGVGDVNGDGYDDLLVADFFSSQPNALVFHGSAAGLETAFAWQADAIPGAVSYAWASGAAGDVNGDGFSDVVVGDFEWSNPLNDEGAVFVYEGSANGLSTAATTVIESNQADSWFGYSVRSAGDVNGDGYGDLIVGAPRYNLNGVSAGAALIYHGTDSGLSTSPAVMVGGESEADFFGAAVASAGDVNGDGFGDVIIGASQFGNLAGKVYVYLGSPAGIVPQPVWEVESGFNLVFFGAVSCAGDLNGDGFSDIVAGYRVPTSGNTTAALVYFGSPLGVSAEGIAIETSSSIGLNVGSSVASAGDTDGDGFGELLIASQLTTAPLHSSAHLFTGNEQLGRAVQPRQLRVSEPNVRIARLGRSDSESSFVLEATMLSTVGRCALTMEQEVKPAGVLFDGNGLVAGPMVDIVDAGEARFTQTVEGLELDRAYHWRVRPRLAIPSSPFQQRGRWISPPFAAASEWDLRTAAPPVSPCIGDFDNNGVIDAADLGTMLGAWGACGGRCTADLNDDSQIDAADLAILLGGWGPC